MNGLYGDVMAVIEVNDRVPVVEYVFSNPHEYTLEDIQWSNDVFGMSYQDCINLFINADKLFAVMVDGSPIYLFAINDGRISTASHSSMEQLRITMTKELRRFVKSPLGINSLTGTVIAYEASDELNGSVRPNWARLLGFVPYEEVVINDQVMKVCYFKGD